jgi:hypothetical protein
MEQNLRITGTGSYPAEKRDSLRSPGDMNNYFGGSRHPRGMDNVNSMAGYHCNIYLVETIA